MCDMALWPKTNSNTEGGVTLLIMESSMEGFNKEFHLKKIGMKSQDTAELFFDNVKVPKENRLGDEKMGFKIMMKELAEND
jgi:alkylation response protein AidB-like acyl-CoA dehydrogenase